MSFNVSAININRKPLFFNAGNYNSEKFVQNSYAVKGNLQFPESRTSTKDFANIDRGMSVYYLA